MFTWGFNIYYSWPKSYIVGYKSVKNIVICRYLVVGTNVVPILHAIELRWDSIIFGPREEVFYFIFFNFPG
jgi:hypothetical protein